MIPAIPFSPRQMIYAAVIAAIFFAGFKASDFIWSARYDSLKAEHAERIEQARQAALTRQEIINEATQEREAILLKKLETQRHEYANLEYEIDTAPLVIERRVPAECGRTPDIDWNAVGRLFDSATDPRAAAEASLADGSDAATGRAAETR